jgi:hypothetical protein
MAYVSRSCDLLKKEIAMAYVTRLHDQTQPNPTQPNLKHNLTQP